MIDQVLLDNSAWASLGRPTLPPERRASIADAFEAGRVFVCLPFLLEAGYSARTGAQHEQIFGELLALPWAAIDSYVEQRARDAQSQLSRAGHHRLPPVDLLVAAIADRHDLGVLHYDADYDLIADTTGLLFASVWVAERGSL